MAPCNGPVGEMGVREALSCSWEKGAQALSMAWRTPGSATIADWAIAFLAALILLNLLALLVSLLLGPRRAL